jgi:type II secretory pathway pseudopilin PulG
MDSLNRGQILTELIIAITITAILAAIGAQLIGVSFYSAGTSKDRQVASRLAEEVFESLRAITQGNTSSTQGWNRLYLPPNGMGTASSSKGVANLYKILILDNTWQIASGTESIVLDGSEYTRSFVIDNVSRDATSGNIQSTYVLANDDPATQKVMVKISKTGAPDFIFEKYFTRYLNESTAQTSWISSLCGPFSATSTQTNYCSKTNIDANTNCVGDSTCFRLSPL